MRTTPSCSRRCSLTLIWTDATREVTDPLPVPSSRHVGVTVSAGSEVTVPRIFVRYRTDHLGSSEVSSVALNPDLPGTTSPPKGGLFDRIQHWTAGADIHAGGPLCGLL